MYKILQELNVPSKLIKIIKISLNETQAKVKFQESIQIRRD